MVSRLSVLGCALVLLACAAYSGQGVSRALVDKARADLKSDRGGEGRAAIFLALNGQHADEVVDYLLTTRGYGHTNPLILSLLGKAALPRLFHHLESGDEQRMHQAFGALCFVGELEPKCVESLRDTARKRPDDKFLQQTSLLLSAIAAPKESERKALLDQLAPPASDGALSTPGLLLVAVSFPPTQAWGMGLLRKQLPRLREAMKAKDWNQNRELEGQFGNLLLGYPIAAREGLLAPADLAALREFCSAFQPTGDWRDLTFILRLTEWLAKSGDTGLLDAALKEMTDESKAEHIRTIMVWSFALSVLQRKHVPLLVERALQPRTDTRIRVGAIGLLARVGAGDERVHRVLKDCLRSRSPELREAAQYALRFFVDKNTYDVPHAGRPPEEEDESDP